MAVDKLVDSTQLDADLTSVANAIRTKGGTSAQLAFPAGFVQAIWDIAGSFNVLSYAKNVNGLFSDLNNCPETVVLDFTGSTTLTTFNGCGFRSTGLKHLTIKNLISETGVSMSSLGYISDFETVTFEGCNFQPTSLESFGRSAPHLKTVNGEIDCTRLTGTGAMSYWFGTAMENFRIKPNTIMRTSVPGFGNSQSWSHATYISIANGLNPTVTGGTLTLTSDQKTVAATIMGTNQDGTFIEDAQGTLALTDFMTNVKGWTLA